MARNNGGLLRDSHAMYHCDQKCGSMLAASSPVNIAEAASQLHSADAITMTTNAGFSSASPHRTTYFDRATDTSETLRRHNSTPIATQRNIQVATLSDQVAPWSGTETAAIGFIDPCM